MLHPRVNFDLVKVSILLKFLPGICRALSLIRLFIITAAKSSKLWWGKSSKSTSKCYIKSNLKSTLEEPAVMTHENEPNKESENKADAETV